MACLKITIKGSQHSGKYIQYIVYGLMLLLPLLMIVLTTYFIARDGYRIYRFQSWKITTGELLSAEIKTYARQQKNSNKIRYSYSLKVAYRYKVDGQEYQSEKWALIPTSVKSKARIESLLKQLQTQKPLQVHYDPTAPAESALYTSYSMVDYVYAGWIIIFLLAFPVYFVFFLRDIKIIEQILRAGSQPRLDERWQKLGISDSVNGISIILPWQHQTGYALGWTGAIFFSAYFVRSYNPDLIFYLALAVSLLFLLYLQKKVVFDTSARRIVIQTWRFRKKIIAFKAIAAINLSKEIRHEPRSTVGYARLELVCRQPKAPSAAIKLCFGMAEASQTEWLADILAQRLADAIGCSIERS